MKGWKVPSGPIPLQHFPTFHFTAMARLLDSSITISSYKLPSSLMQIIFLPAMSDARNCNSIVLHPSNFIIYPSVLTEPHSGQTPIAACHCFSIDNSMSSSMSKNRPSSSQSKQVIIQAQPMKICVPSMPHLRRE